MIQINVLAHSEYRLEFTKKSLSFLKKINNKDKIKLLIGYSVCEEEWKNLSEEYNKCGIFTEIVYSKPGDYMGKIRTFLNTNCEYSCSMDEDLMINEYLWDYMIENINVLDDPKNIFFAPLISNGIPSVEMFIDDFCSNDEKNEMTNIFKNTHIPNLWGADYTHLNDKYLKNEWNKDIYYSLVSKINHYYKGIHPVRVSYEAQIKLAEIICNNKVKFLSKQDYYLEIIKRPYFCNSFYFIKTENWKNIINDTTLVCDGFDEVPLNQYKDRNNMDMVFVRNGFCIHMAYNTINEQRIVEDYFLQKFLNNNDYC
jgi:hypothetical protein